MLTAIVDVLILLVVRAGLIGPEVHVVEAWIDCDLLIEDDTLAVLIEVMVVVPETVVGVAKAVTVDVGLTNTCVEVLILVAIKVFQLVVVVVITDVVVTDGAVTYNVVVSAIHRGTFCSLPASAGIFGTAAA